MEADLPPAAPGILLLLLLVNLGLLGSSSFSIFNNLNTFDSGGQDKVLVVLVFQQGE